MSDLQILLITIGAILIAIVIVYNSWQDWRARRSMRASLPEENADVLMQGLGSSRKEPVLGAGEGMAGTIQESAQAVQISDSAEVDPVCEAVIDIVFEQPVPGRELLPALQEALMVGNKPVRCLLQLEDGQHSGRLELDQSYRSIHLAVLLANRSGPITAIEWSNLWALAQGFAEHYDGMIEAPEQDGVLQQAARLDELCASMDAQVGLILQFAQPLSLPIIVQRAQSLGFVQRAGLLIFLTENGKTRFALQPEKTADGAISRADLVLDVPNSIPDNQAFSHMVGVARELALQFDADVLDDQGRTFEDSAAAAIDTQISAIYDKLDEAGFLAGSARAARVFV